MSKPPDTVSLPEHLRPLTVGIPRTWTPEEALAVFELIDDLRDKVWALYSCQMQALLAEQRCGGRGDNADGTSARAHSEPRDP
ncbi:MAG: hypothetical protein JWQ55_7038 [Rhodopila sp.]|nr:hypothetical protein [Rhodopila sp.]